MQRPISTYSHYFVAIHWRESLFWSICPKKKKKEGRPSQLNSTVNHILHPYPEKSKSESYHRRADEIIPNWVC